MTDKIYCICKTNWDHKHQYRVDKREFTNPNECRTEAKKVGGYLQILKCKDEYGYWHKLSIEW